MLNIFCCHTNKYQVCRLSVCTENTSICKYNTCFMLQIVRITGVFQIILVYTVLKKRGSVLHQVCQDKDPIRSNRIFEIAQRKRFQILLVRNYTGHIFIRQFYNYVNRTLDYIYSNISMLEILLQVIFNLKTMINIFFKIVPNRCIHCNHSDLARQVFMTLQIKCLF